VFFTHMAVMPLGRTVPQHPADAETGVVAGSSRNESEDALAGLE
jgi:hypothetical protein